MNKNKIQGNHNGNFAAAEVIGELWE